MKRHLSDSEPENCDDYDECSRYLTVNGEYLCAVNFFMRLMINLVTCMFVNLFTVTFLYLALTLSLSHERKDVG